MYAPMAEELINEIDRLNLWNEELRKLAERYTYAIYDIPFMEKGDFERQYEATCHQILIEMMEIYGIELLADQIFAE